MLDAHSLEVADNLEVGRIGPQRLLDALADLDTDGADVVVISACVQCPSLAVVEEAEHRLGLPVISAATATTYGVLERLGLDPVLEGAGALLAGPVEASAG